MPFREITIERFDGIVGSADARDLGEGVAAYAENLDPVTEAGLFRGLPEEVPHASGVTAQNFAPFLDGTKAAFYDGAQIAYLTGLGGTISKVALGAATAAGNVTAISNGKNALIGLGGNLNSPPKWVGEISGLGVHNAVITGYPDNTGFLTIYKGVTYSADSGFKAGRTYFYAYSLMYDGFEESPLVRWPNEPGGPVVPGLFIPSDFGDPPTTLLVTFYLQGSFNSRITHIQLYRAEAVGEKADPDSNFVLIDQQAFTGAAGYYIVDDYKQGLDFESRTGFSEVLEHMNVHYGLGVIHEGRLFVAECYVEGIPTAKYQMLASLPGKFGTFDWASDTADLPFAPTALASWSGRLYVFSEGRTAVYAGLDKTEEWEGVGASAKQSVLITDRGMFFANKENIWHHTGQMVSPIGEPILYNDEVPGMGYSAGVHTYPPVLTYHPGRDMVLVCYRNSANFNRIYGYHIGSRRWTVVRLTDETGIPYAGFVSPTGESLLSIGGVLYEMFAGGSRKSWMWVSGIFSLGTADQIFYHVRLNGSQATVSFSEDGQAYSPVTLALDNPSIYAGSVNSRSPGSQHTRTRHFKLKVEGSAAQKVRAIGLTYRTTGPR